MDNGESSYRRYLQGDEDAFDDIVKIYFDPLVFFVERYVHDHAIAEDLAIDVFAEIMVHKTRYDFRVSLKTYIFMIGRSRALTYVKRHKVGRALSFEVISPLLVDIHESELLLKKERDAILHEAINQLPEDMRVSLYLVYFEGLSYEEAARIMRRNKKQVDNLLYRAKQQLRQNLNAEEMLKL